MMDEKEKREMAMAQAVDNTFVDLAVEVANNDEHGMVFFQLDTNEGISQRWACSIRAKDDDGAEIEERGETITEATFKVAEVIRGTR
jgi:hypothetical protein